MTGAAGDGCRRGPADRPGLAWLIDLAAAGTSEPGHGTSQTSATRRDTAGPTPPRPADPDTEAAVQRQRKTLRELAR